MNILFLTVSSNYHAPVLLREVFMKLINHEISVFISHTSSQLTPRQIIKRYGWKYTFYKILERQKFKSLVLRERYRHVDFDERNYLNLSEVLTVFGIPFQNTFNVNRDIQTIKNFQPDLIISLYFDQIIREPLLNLCSYAPLNLHPSFLPAYAGSSPTFWVLAKGESSTGISIHKMVKKIDAGEIVYQRSIEIKSEDTQFSLYRRCTMHFLEPLIDCIELCSRGEDIPSVPVCDNVEASYYVKVVKADVDEFLSRGRKFI